VCVLQPCSVFLRMYSVLCLFYLTTCVCVCHSFHGPLRECLRVRRFRASLLLHLHWINVFLNNIMHWTLLQTFLFTNSPYIYTNFPPENCFVVPPRWCPSISLYFFMNFLYICTKHITNPNPLAQRVLCMACVGCFPTRAISTQHQPWQADAPTPRVLPQ